MDSFILHPILNETLQAGISIWVKIAKTQSAAIHNDYLKIYKMQNIITIQINTIDKRRQVANLQTKNIPTAGDIIAYYSNGLCTQAFCINRSL